MVYGHTLFSTSTNSAELVVLNAISVLLHFVLNGELMEQSGKTDNIEQKKGGVLTENNDEEKVSGEEKEKNSEMSGFEDKTMDKLNGDHEYMSVEDVERAASEFFSSTHGARNAMDLAPWSLISQIPR